MSYFLLLVLEAWNLKYITYFKWFDIYSFTYGSSCWWTARGPPNHTPRLRMFPQSSRSMDSSRCSIRLMVRCKALTLQDSACNPFLRPRRSLLLDFPKPKPFLPKWNWWPAGMSHFEMKFSFLCHEYSAGIQTSSHSFYARKWKLQVHQCHLLFLQQEFSNFIFMGLLLWPSYP